MLTTLSNKFPTRSGTLTFTPPVGALPFIMLSHKPAKLVCWVGEEGMFATCCVGTSGTSKFSLVNATSPGSNTDGPFTFGNNIPSLYTLFSNHPTSSVLVESATASTESPTSKSIP